ncbi:MAG: hypothetical protein DI551_00310 [Micavibrio aeruginosavorus]|uniref:Uncharacterized protein n=1 Tax=Micavibrio aeruginosavorus TaxID=349221 RepID=A0A2W5N986_9BACT|nr:MAG: hypothetical protein DI551_00310 [Micavibrio aeruginosavorus]
MKNTATASILKKTALALALVAFLIGGGANSAKAQFCCGEVSACDGNCTTISQQQTEGTIQHVHDEFTNHREWLIKTFFEQNILPALMLMTEQLTTTAMQQVMIIGSFLDAKHQLETQRLFQELMARAHKDYHPSEGMCTFGTITRSLAASDRNTDLSAMAFSNRVIQRELLSGDTLAGGSQAADTLSRINQYREIYCSTSDNGNGLQPLCPAGSVDSTRINNDISYTNLVDEPLTLKLDLTAEGDPDHDANLHAQTISANEEDLFALASNLYAHRVAPSVALKFLTNQAGEPTDLARNYMAIRAIAAKRSVASNSFAAIASMKSQGEKEVEPYLYAIMKEMGVQSDVEIEKLLGDRPSYFAQMEILTKKLYQNPNFYTELYDKPANVERKTVAMQAIELMQRRDMYRSVLRSEATLSVMLETALMEQQDALSNEIRQLNEDGELVTLE